MHFVNSCLWLIKIYSVHQQDDFLTNSYVDDFVNNPDIVNHPAFPILARRGLVLYNMFGRDGFESRQGIADVGGLSVMLLTEN